MDGVLNVYKEKGYTSHDVVAKLRGILKQKKIGHTGTLDPDAVGVLPVCLGKATKLCDLLTDKDKTYRTTLLFGQTTDTQDASGKVLSSALFEELQSLKEEQVVEVIKGFVGTYEQIPPMYSALKVNGKKLYELARAGIEIERKARTVTINSIEIHKVDLPRVEMEVTCSKGTYIRTLCHDIGEKLLVGGIMEELTRTRVDRFRIEDSFTLSQIEMLRDKEQLVEHILPLDQMFQHYPAYYADEKLDKALNNGNLFHDRMLDHESGIYRIYDSKKRFIGLYEKTDVTYRPYKMFL
ncbi:MAG: tRNA pseudouridine(55) synthase TruB [Clostridia bacterium]|nr:tRNA pseudouridine(55) synthase TruB [Clostridia bacterium]